MQPHRPSGMIWKLEELIPKWHRPPKLSRFVMPGQPSGLCVNASFNQGRKDFLGTPSVNVTNQFGIDFGSELPKIFGFFVFVYREWHNVPLVGVFGLNSIAGIASVLIGDDNQRDRKSVV